MSYKWIKEESFLQNIKKIIKLITEQGRMATRVARKIGDSEAAVRIWVKEYSAHGDNAFPGKGKLRPEDEELRLLKKKMVDLEEENAMLKKATCIFTKPEK